MSSQGVATTAVYMAYNTSTGAYVTGDVANHTIKLVKDGTEAAPTNSPSEVDSTNCPGAYKLALTAAETQFGTVWIGGKSATANVIIVPITLTFEILPTALDANGMVKADVEDIKGTASAGAAGSVGIDWAHVSNPTTALDLSGTTIKNLDGNTVQTGDAFALIGAAGVGLTNLGDTRIAHLNADVSSRASPADILTTALSESYAALHAAPTLAQVLFEIRGHLCEKSVAGTTLTTKKLDGATAAETFTLNDSVAPTSITRAS